MTILWSKEHYKHLVCKLEAESPSRVLAQANCLQTISNCWIASLFRFPIYTAPNHELLFFLTLDNSRYSYSKYFLKFPIQFCLQPDKKSYRRCWIEIEGDPSLYHELSLRCDCLLGLSCGMTYLGFVLCTLNLFEISQSKKHGNEGPLLNLVFMWILERYRDLSCILEIYICFQWSEKGLWLCLSLPFLRDCR